MLYNAFDDHAMEMIDSLNASFAIEMRHPLRSRKIIEYALSLPERLRLRGDRTKYIHVQALANLMPQAILQRTDKAEFSTTFRKQLDHMKELFTEELPKRRTDWVTRDGMNRLYGFYKKNPKAGWPLWVLWNIFGCDAIPS
jgi:asparagine synthase (glutamine-hydrolysing)